MKDSNEQQLDKNKVQEFYNLCLRRRFGTNDPEHLRQAELAKGIRMRIITGYRNAQLVTVTDKKNRVLGQMPVERFYPAEEPTEA